MFHRTFYFLPRSRVSVDAYTYLAGNHRQAYLELERSTAFYVHSLTSLFVRYTNHSCPIGVDLSVGYVYCESVFVLLLKDDPIIQYRREPWNYAK